MACNAERLFKEHGIDGRIPIAEAGEALLGSAPEKAQREIEQILRSRGVEVLLGSEVARITERTAHAHDGRRIGFDVAIPAVGTRPPEVFCESGLATGDDYGLWVNCYLQSISDPCVFGKASPRKEIESPSPKTHGSSPNARGRYFSTILRPT